MPTFQTNLGPIGIETPLGKDKVILTSFTGEEHMSGLFRFDLRLMSEDGGLKAPDLVGKPVDFWVRYADDTPRYFHGIVSRLIYSGQTDRSHLYSAEVVPWMWLLTKGSDCRVHETEKTKSAKEIIDGLLGDLGFTDYEWNLKRTPEKREYCVQYRETHYDFVSRLLQEEGIYFYFRHEQGKHTLVLTDHVDGVFDCRDANVQMLSTLAQPEETDNLNAWNHNWEFTSGKYTHTDYNFETPSTSLLLDKKSLVSLPGNSKLEYYDFPGVYGDKGLGDSLAKLRIEGEEARYNTVNGASSCRSFSPGGRFKVEKHHDAAEAGGKWVLLSVRHEASLGGSYVTTSDHSELIYQNSFQCIPSDVVYRPPYRPRAGVHGIQTAIIVGPPGEEIHTDKYGRVKVQFYWDRRGKKDDHSSAWIRVSQVHAGAGWGMMDLPRIGEEVIVSFLEGNPERPMIIGRVYHAECTPPFSLPAEKTRRGNMTKSHKASGFNEMSMDDTAGKEQIRINAQYDMNTNVNHSQTLKVGVDRSNDIGNNEAIKIGNDQTLEIKANQTIKIGSLMKLTVGSDQQIEIGSNRKDDVKADETTKIGGKQSLTVGADRTINVTGKQLTEVKGDATLTSAAKIKIEATASIELICGSSTIKIDPTGVEIKGAAIKIEGTTTASMKSPASTVEGDTTLTLKGGMTKIN